MAFCANCGAQVADNAAFCPSCGKAAGVGGTATGGTTTPTAGGLTDNVAGMLAYITIIPAIIFLVMEPYNRSKFVRFHSFQSIFFCVAVVVVSIVVSILTAMPVLWLVTWVLWPILWIGCVIVWVILLIKANQGQMWKLPLIGDLAAKQAGV